MRLRTRLDHVELLLVRRKAQAVRAVEIGNDLRNRVVFRIDPIDSVRQFWRGLVPLPLAADAKRRIGEPERAVGLADDVVGGVEALALVAVCKDRDGPVVLGAGDAARQVLAADQPALLVTAVAIAEVGRLAEHAPLVGGFVVTNDAVVGDVRKQQVAAVAEPDRPFHPAEARGELLHGGAEQAVFGKAGVEDLHGRVGIALARLEFESLGESHAAGSRRCGRAAGFQQRPPPCVDWGVLHRLSPSSL
ncbi:hypothetical protein D3C81_1240670 [compost metagenome]